MIICRFILAVVLLAVLLGGCTLGPSHRIASGYLVNDGIVLSADDGSFSFKGGSEFTAPFNADSFEWSDHSCKEFMQFRDDVRNAYNTALEMGAKRVKIIAPGMAKPMHGVLLLGMTKKDCSGPASKSYRIEIPQQYIDAALQGRVSVVYESMPCDFSLLLKKASFLDDFRYPECGLAKDSWYSWILWLSDQPFR